MQLNLFVPNLSLKTISVVTGFAIALMAKGFFVSSPPMSLPVALPGDDKIAAAAGNQTAPQIASGANGFLVVWQDNRSQIYDSSLSTCGSWTGSGAGSNNDIYAARLDANGQLIDTTPIILSPAPTCQSRPGVAWNGQNWLVVWISQKADPFGIILEGVRVAPLGQVLDQTPILLSPNAAGSSNLQLTSDGTNWMVIWSGGRGISGVLVGADGTVDASSAKLLYQYSDPLPPTVQVNADIAFAGDEYLLVWSEIVHINPNLTTSMLKAQRLNRALAPLSNVVTLRAAGASRPCVATDGQNFLVATGNVGWLVARGGQVISSDLMLSALGGAAEVCWDGANYYIVGYKEDFSIFAAKIAPNGTRVSPNGVDLKQGDRNFDVVIAPRPNGGGAQAVWMTQKVYQPHADAVNYYLSSDLDVLTAGVTSSETATPVAPVGVSAPRQSLSQMAAGNDGFLLAYRSQISGDSRIMATKLDAEGNPVGTEPIRLDSGYPGITNPTVAWNGSSYLVVWENSQEPTGGFATQQGTIYGRRLGADGAPLDAALFKISLGKNARVAAMNGEFFVVGSYEFDGSVIATRINANGQILQSSTILPGSVGLSSGFILPSIAQLGNRWLMVGTVMDSAGCNCIWGVFISPQGVPADRAFKISGQLGDCGFPVWGFEPQIASAGDSALVIYRGRTAAVTASDLYTYGGITARRIKADGTFDANTLAGFPVSPNGYIPSVAWDGFGYLTNWFDQRNALYPKQSSGDIFATRIDVDGSIKDAEGFAVADSPLPEDKPTVAARNGIGVFAWSVMANQAPYGTMRIHLRTVRDSFLLPPVAPQLFSYSVGWNVSALVWRDNSSNEDGFKIERCAGLNCTNFAEIASVPANKVQYDDGGLMPQSWYSYRLRAFNSVGNSEYTSVIQLRTADPPNFSITGRLTDRNGKALENYSLTLTGAQSGFARTDRYGYYRLSSIPGGGNYRVTAQSPGPRIGFTTYYPNPGWVEFKSLAADQSANFVYNLTSPPSSNDGMILNPNFDQGGANWMTGGPVSFANGIARLTPTNSFAPSSITQWVQLTAGVTYEVAADLAANASARITFGVKFEGGSSGPSMTFTNNTRPTTLRVRFTVPAGTGQVAFMRKPAAP